MCQLKNGAGLLFIYISLICILCGCSKEQKTFPIEELEDYAQPVVLLSSRETGETYLITLDEPDIKYDLEYDKIWDSWPETQTFLFRRIADEKESICRYDMVKKEYELLLTEDMVCEYLELEQDAKFDSVYYYFDEDVFSFVYGDNLLIYDADAEEYIFSTPVSLGNTQRIYDWKAPQLFLMKDFSKTYEVNISTGSLEKVEVDDGNLGLDITLTADGSMGCSHGDENIMGAVFSPVLIWDTETYTVKRFREGIAFTLPQLSYDNKYVLLSRSYVDKPDKLLCLRVEDDSLCETYVFDEDERVEYIWWW